MSHGVVTYKCDKEVSSTSFEWSIPKVFHLENGEKTTYSSPSIDVFGGSLFLKIFTTKVIDGFALKEFLDLSLSGLDVGTDLRFTVGVKTTDGAEETLKNAEMNLAGCDSLLLNFLLCWSELKRRSLELAPSDVLTLTFTFEKESQSTRTDDPTLHTHLKDLLYSGDDHDVVIRVKHKEFRAHKCVLRARSPVFAAMFRHDMKEKTGSSVWIEDCEPEAFANFLNYIYTGKFGDPSPSKAMGLYYLGDKYDFLLLKKVCVEYLKDSLSISAICDVVDLARRHGENELLQSAISFFSRNIKKILCSEEWRELVKKDFDVANELYIKAYEAK